MFFQDIEYKQKSRSVTCKVSEETLWQSLRSIKPRWYEEHLVQDPVCMV